MAGRVDQVDQETIAILLLGDVGKILVGKLVVQGDTAASEGGREGEKSKEREVNMINVHI